MLDIKKVESKNEVTICGLLNELDVTPGTTTDGREYIRGRARIQVDQEINGGMVTSEVPVSMFAMKLKKDGTANKAYSQIMKYKEDFVSAGSVEDKSEASRVTVSGGYTRISENIYMGRNGSPVSTFQIEGNYINPARPGENDCAKFELSGVVGKKIEEQDKDGNETGRLLISLVVITFGGRANKINLIAEGNAKAHIENNWNEGDTVQLTGRIRMTYKVETIIEEQGFGEPIEHTKTTSLRELVITGGSPEGLDSALSYDASDIKLALDERAARIEDIKNKATQKKAAAPKNTTSFDF